MVTHNYIKSRAAHISRNVHTCAHLLTYIHPYMNVENRYEHTAYSIVSDQLFAQLKILA